MVTKEQMAILGELEKRVQANHIGSLVFFRKAGLPIIDEEEITLEDLQQLHAGHPEVFGELIDFLYPEKRYANANAFFSSGWGNVVGGILQGAGQGFMAASGGGQQATEAEILAEREKMQNEANDKKQKTIAIAAVAVVGLVVVLAVLFKK